MKNAMFWDVTPCGSCENRRFGGTSNIGMKGISELGNTLAVTSMFYAFVSANIVPSSLIIFIPKMVTIRSSEMSVLTRATQRNSVTFGNEPS
jgi:hypothetical protein